MSTIMGTTRALLKKNLTCKKICMLIFFLCFIILPYAIPAVRTAKAHSWRLPPYLFIFLCNDPFAYMLLMGGSLFLFMDPTYDSRHISEPRHITRVLGSALYIFTVSLIYILMIFVVSFVTLLPTISFEADWGLGWKMLAFSDANEYPALFAIDTQIMKTYSAINAMILSGLFAWAFLILLGLASCLYNIIKPDSSPVYLLLAIIISDTSIYNMYLSSLMKFSPMTLSVLSTYTRETKQQYGISLEYGGIFYAVLIMVLILLCVCFFQFKKAAKLHNNPSV